MIYSSQDIPAGTKLCSILTGNKVRRASSPVTTTDLNTLQNSIWKMIRACIVDGGIGLAAPQIGIFKRLFIVAEETGFRAYINPSFTVLEDSTNEPDVEGCLSVPGKRLVVYRPNSIRAQWFELTNEGALEVQEATCKGMRARVFLHENDHLNGVTIEDKGRKR
jgi:peptide deformylase